MRGEAGEEDADDEDLARVLLVRGGGGDAGIFARLGLVWELDLELILDLRLAARRGKMVEKEL